MNDARALFFSLADIAQIPLRGVAQQHFADRKLTRAVYGYVQTPSEAQDVADFLLSIATLTPSHSEEIGQICHTSLLVLTSGSTAVGDCLVPTLGFPK
jgi:hypothetical protein